MSDSTIGLSAAIKSSYIFVVVVKLIDLDLNNSISMFFGSELLSVHNK